MIASLKADPVGWYKANKLNSAQVAADTVAIAEEEQKEDAKRHGGMEAWRHGGMEAWRHGGMEA